MKKKQKDNQRIECKKYIIVYSTAIPILIAFIALLIYGYLPTGNYVGKYSNSYAKLELVDTNSFTLESFMIKFQGNYTVQGEKIVFNINTMNGNKYYSNVVGQIGDGYIIGPDKKRYIKEAK